MFFWYAEGDSPSKKKKKSLDEAGSLLGVQAMMKLNDYNAMSKFVESLHLAREDLKRAKEELGFVICLPEDVSWIGNDLCFRNELFVQKSYIELRKAHYALNHKSYILFTSTPGIGKSHLAALMVAQFLINGKIVLLEVVSLATVYYRLQFSKGGSATVHQTYDLMTALTGLEDLGVGPLVGEVKEPVYVVDGGYPSLYDHFFSKRCEKFIFGSPRREYQRIEKKNPVVLVQYVSLFDLEELLRCAKEVTRFRQIKA